MKILVTGARGFIGSHLCDALVAEGHNVVGIDDLSSGLMSNTDSGILHLADISDFEAIRPYFTGIDYVFHTAAVARTPMAVDYPLLCNSTNVTGSLNVLEASRQAGVKRVILSSSSIVYAAETAYKASKLAMEMYAKVYRDLYGQSNICLRYSNVYGPRQREDVPGPNVFAALRKSKREQGKIFVTGDGEQSRSYTHVSDIVRGNLLAMKSDYAGEIDLCTGIQTTMNEVAKFYECPVEHIEDRKGDWKHIVQSPAKAKEILGWEAQVPLAEGIKDCL